MTGIKLSEIAIIINLLFIHALSKSTEGNLFISFRRPIYNNRSQGMALSSLDS